MKALIVATAPPFCVNVGRITEHGGRLLLMNSHGSGRIRFVWSSSELRALRSGNVRPVAECGDIGRIAPLDSSQFVVLLPQVSLYKFRCRREPQKGSIASGKLDCASCGLRVALGPQ